MSILLKDVNEFIKAVYGENDDRMCNYVYGLVRNKEMPTDEKMSKIKTFMPISARFTCNAIEAVYETKGDIKPIELIKEMKNVDIDISVIIRIILENNDFNTLKYLIDNFKMDPSLKITHSYPCFYGNNKEMVNETFKAQIVFWKNTPEKYQIGNISVLVLRSSMDTFHYAFDTYQKKLEMTNSELANIFLSNLYIHNYTTYDPSIGVYHFQEKVDWLVEKKGGNPNALVSEKNNNPHKIVKDALAKKYNITQEVNEDLVQKITKLVLEEMKKQK